MGNPADTITTADVAPRTASQQITGFIDDASSVPASLPALKEPDGSIIAATVESRLHTIVDVLARPTVVAKGQWTDAAVRDAQLVKLDFPEALFDVSSNLVCKLEYFTYLRADVCIRVVINANTFQCGKLLGYFTPFESLVGNRASASNFTSSYTAFPHVLLDASTGNVAELRIPYVSPYSAYRLVDSTGSIGSFYLRVLNGLRTGNCTYTVYAWFTNISVDLPSGRELFIGAQGKAMKAFKQYLKDKEKQEVTVETKLTRGGKPRFIAQVNGEEEQKSRGIISSTLHKVSHIAELAAGIPILAEIAYPVSWVTKFAGTLAEYFGYSKTQNQSTPQFMINVPAKGFTNANGVDNSVILATSLENKIEPRNDVFGSSVDDMQISYLVKHRCYVDSFEMKTDQIAGTELYSFPVTPGWAKQANGVFKPSVTAFVASMFTLWRGGLKFKIQAAKTAYHSGRVRIVYLPAATTSQVDDSEQAYNWVLDLRNSSEIEFTIPYNNILEWAQLRLVDNIATSSVTSIGVIRIEVLNELRAPDSVTPTIEFNVWMSGDSDLQFAIPSFDRYVPSLADPSFDKIEDLRKFYTDTLLKTKVEEPVFEAQVLGSQQDRGFNDMGDKPQLFAMKVPDKIVPCKTAIGEIITNLRYIIRRFAPVVTVAKQASTSLHLDIPLYYFTRVFDPSQDSLLTYRIPPIDYVSYLYRFFRGGIRYKFMLDSTDLNGNLGYQEAILAPSYSAPTSIRSINQTVYDRLRVGSCSFMHRVYSLINPILEIATPFYSQAPIRPIVGNDTAQPTDLLPNSLFYKWGSSTSGEVSVMKSSHDDFSFGWIVGPPKLRSRDAGLVVVPTSPGIIESNTETTVTYVAGVPTTTLPSGTYSVLFAVPNSVDCTFTNTTTTPMSPTQVIIQAPGAPAKIIFTLSAPVAGRTINNGLTINEIQAIPEFDFILT